MMLTNLVGLQRFEWADDGGAHAEKLAGVNVERLGQQLLHELLR